MVMTYAIPRNDVNMIYFRYVLSHSSLDGSLPLVSKLLLSRMGLIIVVKLLTSC